MKLGPVTNLDRRNMATQKKVGADVLSASNDVIAIFQFMANLLQFGSRTPEAWSADISKIKEVLVRKVYLVKVTLFLSTYLPKFKVLA